MPGILLRARSRYVLNVAALLTAITLLTAPADSTQVRSNVLWTPDTYVTMSFLYEQITARPAGVEFAACLRARRSGRNWIVTEVVIPSQRGNTASSIESADCTGYEGAAHSHPLDAGQRHCFPSAGDRATFAASANEFLVIWCDVEAFTFRTRDLGIGGKDDVERDRSVSTSPEPHLWRSPAAESRH
jgi:hypothetical protein